MRKQRRKYAQRRNTEPRKTPHVTPSSLLAKIEKPVYGGEFLARVDGKAVFVPLTLPGEQVRARVVEEKRGYAKAEIEKVVYAAAERISPQCVHFGACGGCQYQHTDDATQVAFKQAILRETLERGGISVPGEIQAIAGEPWAYRNRIRLAFDREGYAGYRGRRSHALIRIAECSIAAPLLVRAAVAAGEMVSRMPARLRPGEMSLFCNAGENALLVSISTTSGPPRWFKEFVEGFAETISETKGIELVTDAGRDEGPRSLVEWGESSLLYRAAGFDYRVDQGAFFQVNRWLIDPLVDLVTGHQHGKVAWDLFAGVGLFARRLAEKFDRLIAVEAAKDATNALAQNLAGTESSVIESDTAHFLRGAGGRERPDFVVVDPPRAGLGPEVTEMLARIGAPRLTYVSCDPATLARDLRTLMGAGYLIDKTALVDLFPQTFHLETVIALRR
jgi:23S rRNA (uracil1939-C5)-methyltransferase